jgi:hypothetical protein
LGGLNSVEGDQRAGNQQAQEQCETANKVRHKPKISAPALSSHSPDAQSFTICSLVRPLRALQLPANCS